MAEEEKQASKENNPFTNHLVLESVFKFLSGFELTRARLVSRQWHYISFPFWRNHVGPIHLVEKEQDAVFETGKYMTLSSFMNLHKSGSYLESIPTGWPYERFKLSHFLAVKGCKPGSDLDYFWQECGPWITFLEIFGCSILDWRTYKNLLLSKFTPNLRTFLLTCQYVGTTRSDQNDDVDNVVNYAQNENLTDLSIFYCVPQITWMELLSCYPNLQNFKLFFPYKTLNRDRELEKLLTTIKNIRRKNKKNLPITSLTLQRTDEVSHLELPEINLRYLWPLLSSSQLPLESLNLSIEFFTQGQDFALRDVLAAAKENLKKLTLRCCSRSRPVDFPVSSVLLEKLEELTLIGKRHCNLSFLKSTPNLKLLHLRNPWRSHSSDKLYLRGLVMCSNLQKMEFLSNLRIDYDFSSNNLTRLMRWMPNLLELEMPLTNETVRVVYQFCPKLKRLVIQRERVDDDGIVGDCGKNVMGHADNSKLNISSLTQLRSFEMINRMYAKDDVLDNHVHRSNTFMIPTKLTDKSIRLGFLQLRSLHRIALVVEEMSVSEEALDALKAHVWDVTVLQISHPYRRPLFGNVTRRDDQ